MSHWYVVQVMSGQEKKVKRALEENRDSSGMTDMLNEILLPTENVADVKAGKQTITEKRLWPGYILLRMNLTDDSWMYVKNTNGVIGFLGGEKPTPLTSQEVKEILDEIRNKKDEVVLKHKIEPGDLVKITEGVFVNFTGEVIEVNPEKGRLSVLVSIFGRETRVDDLEFCQVEKVAREA